MSQPEEESALEFSARTYDVSVPDWPGALDFYRELTAPLLRAALHWRSCPAAGCQGRAGRIFAFLDEVIPPDPFIYATIIIDI